MAMEFIIPILDQTMKQQSQYEHRNDFLFELNICYLNNAIRQTRYIQNNRISESRERGIIGILTKSVT